MMLFSLAETTKELQQQVNTLQKELALAQVCHFFLNCFRSYIVSASQRYTQQAQLLAPMQTPIIQTLDSNGEQIRYQSVPIVPLYGSREQVIVMTCYVGISPRPRVVPEDVWEMPAMPAPCLGIYALEFET